MTRINRTLGAAVIGVAALLACAKGEQASKSADSTARNLTLAPTESSAAMKDVPAPAAPPAAKPAPAAAKAPAPKPAAPAMPATLTAAAGTKIGLSVRDTITTRTAKAGDAFTATVGQDVKDAAGDVVIPEGSTVSGTIVEAAPAPNPRSTGSLKLAITSVTVRGTSYPVEASVESKDTLMQGRGVTGADVGKVGAGAAVGAIAGRIIGKNAKGTVIGGAVGAATGAAAAARSRDVDVVLPKGAKVTITLTKPLSVKRT